MNQIIVGPLLGFEEGNFYSVCILLEAGSPNPVLGFPGLPQTHPFSNIATVGSNEFWRAEFPSPAPAAGWVEYSIRANGTALLDQHDRATWKFYVPGAGEEPVFAYASCNGFSSAKLARDTNEPYILWERMADTHFGKSAQNGEPAQAAQPFSLLLMGGDQVYADEIWESQKYPSLKRWSELSWAQQEKAKVSAAMASEIAKFYDGLYLNRWQDQNMSLMFASIPSVMMWDDHDIFDGWGSYPEGRQNCAVYQAVFKEAARVFDVFQLRCGTRNRLNAAGNHRTLRLRFGNYHILALDNRSERSQTSIMSEENWQDTKSWLTGLKDEKIPNLLVMTGVPVVYRSFATVEAAMDFTFWHEELEDDVHDHWSSRPHVSERMRLVMVLLEFLQSQKDERGKCLCNGVLLSGDVHVGALGQIWNEREELGLTQIISTGIVHPPPTAFAWAGIEQMTSDTPEALGDGETETEMLTPFGSPRYLRTRNFATLHTGTDKKIWVNWVCEDDRLSPNFAIGTI
jgi:hypothetical protein